MVKSLLISFATTAVVIAVVFRVEAIRKVVVGN